MQPRSSIQKGKRLENWIIDQLCQSGVDNHASRTPGSGSGIRKGDVWTKIGWTIEAKHEIKPKWWQNIDQAKKQAQRANSSPSKWCLIANDPRKGEFQDVYAVIDFHEFLELVKNNQPPKTESPDRAFKYKLEKLKQAVKDLLGEL